MGPIPSGLSTTVTLELTAEGGVLREGTSFDLILLELEMFYKFDFLNSSKTAYSIWYIPWS